MYRQAEQQQDLLFSSYLRPRGTPAFSTFAWPPLPPLSLRTVQPPTSSVVLPEQQPLRIQCIGAIQERILSKMGPLFPPNNKVVMLDWPQYWNLGDTLIWAGEFNFLKALGMYPPLQQAVSLPDYAVRRLSQNVTLFWTGGGNFGDLWRVHSDMRNKLIRLMLASSMHNPLIIGPQSIFYNRTQTAEEDARLFAKAPQIILTLRDRESWQFSQKYFRNTQRELLPDMAFMNGPLRPNREPLYDFLVLLRKDIETRFPDPLFAKEMTAVMDAHAISYRIVDWSDWEELVEDSLWKEEHPEDLTEMTLWQVELANNILSLGHRVISDRLHATLMSMLLGKEVIYLDNIYKKISNTLETAFEVHPSCSSKNMGGKRANTLKEAAEIAVEWVRAERNE
ncbi:Polysaccharide pyruvyl transferase YvfF [Balamuthia mandrillaris]